jgi:4-nitrophenyl phosphatase
MRTAVGDLAAVPAGADVPPAVRERLHAVRGFVFDMDGTLVLGDRHNRKLVPLPGALEITRWVTMQGKPFAIFTNGTTRTPQQYAQTLRSIGFDLPDHAMLTPASSAVAVFTRRRYRRVLVLGEEGVAGPLRDAGIEVVHADGVGTLDGASAADGAHAAYGAHAADASGTDLPGAAGAVDAVLVGWYPNFTMPALEAACHAVWGGAALYSCSQSMFFATTEGRAIGTSRAISAMIKSLTGCRVRVVGKPSLDALRSAGQQLGVPPADLAVVGDDPELEVPMAHRGHALAVAVTSGLGAADSFDHLPPVHWPHLRVGGVDELLSILSRPSGGTAPYEENHIMRTPS